MGKLSASRLPVHSCGPRDRSSEWRSASSMLRNMARKEEPVVLPEHISTRTLGAGERYFDGGCAVLQKGQELRGIRVMPERPGNDGEGALGSSASLSESGSSRGDTSGYPDSLYGESTEDSNSISSSGSESSNDGLPLVLGRDGNREKYESEDGESRLLPEKHRQMVVRLRRAGLRYNRRMVPYGGESSDEDGLLREAMAGPPPVPSGEQGRMERNDTAEEDHHHEQLFTPGMFS